jgi:hypothetical protein
MSPSLSSALLMVPSPSLPPSLSPSKAATTALDLNKKDCWGGQGV